MNACDIISEAEIDRRLVSFRPARLCSESPGEEHNGKKRKKKESKPGKYRVREREVVTHKEGSQHQSSPCLYLHVLN